MAIESLVVDDEPLARDLLAGYVKQTPFLHFAGACSSAVEALTVLQREKIDLIFLDIQHALPNTIIRFFCRKARRFVPKNHFTEYYYHFTEHTERSVHTLFSPFSVSSGRTTGILFYLCSGSHNRFEVRGKPFSPASGIFRNPPVAYLCPEKISRSDDKWKKKS